MLARSAQIAIQEGHFRADLDPKQFAFEMQAIVLGLNFYRRLLQDPAAIRRAEDRSEEHTSELQSLMRISYAVFCLKKKTSKTIRRISSRPTTNIKNRKSN